MTGTPNQISWAGLIRVQVNDEFDRVSKVLQARGRTSLMEILEDKRSAVLSNQSAGYFIEQWGELNGQVRRMIMEDPRYTTLRPPSKA